MCIRDRQYRFSADFDWCIRVMKKARTLHLSLIHIWFISALTNRKETLHKDYYAVFWFSLMCSTTIYILLFCAAPLIDVYKRQDIQTGIQQIVRIQLPRLPLIMEYAILRKLRLKHCAALYQGRTMCSVRPSVAERRRI